MDLVKRRQVLLNLISRVGRGQQNIYRWVDELMEIDAQLEQQQQESGAMTTTTYYEYVIKFSDSEDYISDKNLAKLAVLWQGVVKDGDILTSLYPEDFCDDRTYFPIRASWDEYVPKYSDVEAWEVPTPTGEEWQKAVQDPTFLSGKPYTKWLESTQPWTIVKFVPAHHEWRTDSPSYFRESSDGYRSGGSGGDRTRHYQVLIPDTWTWQSAAGTQAETLDESTPPKVFNKYTYQWYVERIQSEYKDGYFARQRQWKENWKANKPSEIAKKAAKESQAAKEKAIKLAEEAAQKAKLNEAASKIDAVWEQLLLDCPLAVKKGLADCANDHKITSPGSIALGQIAKYGTCRYTCPEKFQKDFLEGVYEKELMQKRNAILSKYGLQINPNTGSIVRIDGKKLSIKSAYLSRYGKSVRSYGASSVDLADIYHVTEADGLVLPPTKSFEKWLQLIA